jgi:hypothetical protein
MNSELEARMTEVLRLFDAVAADSEQLLVLIAFEMTGSQDDLFEQKKRAQRGRKTRQKRFRRALRELL